MSEDLSILDPATVATDAHADGSVHAAPATNADTLEAAERLVEEMEWILFYDLAMHWHRQSGSYVASDTAALLQRIQMQIHAMIDRQPRLECFRPRSW